MPHALMVYAGERRWRSEPKPVVQLYRVNADGSLGASFAYVPSQRGGRYAFSILGGVYRVEVPEDKPDMIVSSSALLVDRWTNASDVLAWRAEHDAARAATAAAKLKGVDEATLDTLKATYRRLPPPARALFLSRLVYAVTH